MAEGLVLSSSSRVIGQILQQRSFDIFELKYLDNRFVPSMRGFESDRAS